MKSKLLNWVGILLAVSLCFFIFSQVYQGTLPKIVEEINNSAIGAILTAFVTVLLLQGQTASEEKRDKSVKVFEQKIKVYSEFTNKMWEMLDDDNINEKELKELRNICFKALVFYLGEDQIKGIAEEIRKIDLDDDPLNTQIIIGKITRILQSDINGEPKKIKNNLRTLFKSKTETVKTNLSTLYNAFKLEKKEDNADANTGFNISPQQSPITYWHFNILNERHQLKAFKDGNWVLALIEYGQDWRTNLIRQVKRDDVIFLFKRGGAGYIGAFRAKDNPAKILEAGNEYTETEIKKFDIYGGLEDGASLCSNILVEPIAFNYGGVGYKSVRRRTIERMNDIDSVNFLLKRFNGNDMKNEWLEGKKDMLAENVKIPNLNKEYFNEVLKKNNL